MIQQLNAKMTCRPGGFLFALFFAARKARAWKKAIDDLYPISAIRVIAFCGKIRLNFRYAGIHFIHKNLRGPTGVRRGRGEREREGGGGEGETRPGERISIPPELGEERHSHICARFFRSRRGIRLKGSKKLSRASGRLSLRSLSGGGRASLKQTSPRTLIRSSRGRMHAAC